MIYYPISSASHPNVSLYSYNNGLNRDVTFNAPIQANPQKQTQSDLSSNQKAVIGIGLITAIAIGCDYFFCKGKHVKQLTGGVKKIFNPKVKPEIKPQVKSSVKPEIKVEVMPEAKPMVKPEVKPEVKPAVKPEVKPEAKPAVKPEIKPEAKPAVKPEIKPQVNIFDYGKRTIQTPLKLKAKDGSLVECTLNRRYIVDEGPFGKRVDVVYNVTDINGNKLGTFDGMIDLSKGVFSGHGIQNFGKKCGLGKTMKKYIAEDAKLYKCKSIDIDAAYASHMFHNKMGYKCDLLRVEYAQGNAIKALENIKQSGTMPEFEQQINELLQTKDLSKINGLLDDIFTSANSKRLNSEHLGINNIQIPMTLKL